MKKSLWSIWYGVKVYIEFNYEQKKQDSQPAPTKAETPLEINKHASEPVNKDVKKVAKEDPAKKVEYRDNL